jgi:ATP-dependent Clp protease ATP-binding subunit ClpC
LVRELVGGAHQATSLGRFGQVSFGTEVEAVDQQRRFMEALLLQSRAPVIAGYETPPDLELRHIGATVVRLELPRRLRRPLEIELACVLVPGRGGTWALVPGLGQAIWAGAREDRDQVFCAELERILGAADSRDLDVRRLLPADDAWIEPVEVELLVGDEGISGRAASLRKRRIAEHRRKVAFETLEASAQRIAARPAHLAPELCGRSRELGALAALMSGEARASVAVVGEESSGKSELIRAWADRQAGERPIFATSVAQLVAGASGFGEWQERVHAFLDAAEEVDAVIYFDNLGELFSEHPEAGGVDVAGLLRAYVVNERVRVLGEISPVGLERACRHQVALLAAIASVRIEPLDPQQTVDAVRARIALWDAVHERDPAQPTVDPAVAQPLVDLAERYLPYRSDPGKSIGLLEELRATRSHIRDAEGRTPPIAIDDCYDAFALATRIPRFLIRDDQPLAIGELEARFWRRMIGQKKAIRAVAETICTVKARLAPADKPLSTFLFVGPTGVGKTELARSLAKILFGAEERMVRFDMSEYTDGLAAERLIRGAGSRDGLMTTRVREQPFCVVLLDEIEKAHPAVHDLLLQVCGSGRLTDARGRTTLFHNAIIIMTSNLGAAHRRAAIGPGQAARDDAEHFERAVRQAFRPEMQSRIDRIVSFSPLTREEVARVTDLALSRITERRGFLEAGVALDLTTASTAALASGGYSEAYGVRALRRHLDDNLVTPIAHQLARLGARARGARIWVGLAGEEPPADYPKSPLIASDARGDLELRVYQRPGAVGRVALRGVAAAAEMRRFADHLMGLDEAEEVREQLGQLRAQLATFNAPKKRRKKKDPRRAARRAAEITELQSSYHRYSSAWEPVEAARADLWAAEELCITAVLEGEDAGALTGEVRAGYTEFLLRFFWVLVANRGARDLCGLRIRRVGGVAPIREWLAPMLEYARRRGWTVEGRLPAHQPGAPRGAGYKPEHKWSAPMPLPRLETEVESAPDAIRQLLLVVRGRDASVLLPPERGLHKFDGYSNHEGGDYLMIDVVSVVEQLTDWQLANTGLATPPPRELSPRTVGDRLWTKGSTNVVVSGADAVDIAGGGYFAMIEAIGVLSLLAARDKTGIAAVFAGGWATPLGGST